MFIKKMQMFIRKLIKSLPNMQVFIYSSIKSLCVGSALLDTRLPAAERQIITDAFAPYQDKGIQLGACHFCKSKRESAKIGGLLP